jgi:hypothetical protein
MAPTSMIGLGDHDVKVGAAARMALPVRVRITVQPPERRDID